MSDIALQLGQDNIIPTCDFVIENGDLKLDETLHTPFLLSILTDREAEADDALPDDSDTDRRGWWGDMAISSRDAPDPIGSRLWLLERAKAVSKTATNAKHYIFESLQWMITDGVVKSIAPEANWNAPGFLAIAATLSKADATGKVDVRYDAIWKATV